MQSSAALVRGVPYVAKLALIVAAYLLAARLSLSLAIPPGYASAVWPPSGIALAAALLLGQRIWPGIWLGAALANVTVESSFVLAAVMATGNTLEALVGAALIRQHVQNPGQFDRGEDVVKFIALCALSATIAATIAQLALASGHSLSLQDGLRNWWTWWQGDLSGMIIVAPLILSWIAGNAVPWPRQKKLEAACFGLLLIVTASTITAGEATDFAPFSVTFVSLPFIIWGAFRFGQREVATAIAVVCAVAVWYVLGRRELFESVPLNEVLLMLLTFISMVVTTGLVLVAVLRERSRGSDELRRRYDELESSAKSQASAPATGEAIAGAAPKAEKVAVENELRQALGKGEFVLHYQPRVDIETRSIVGVEALLHWQSRNRGLVPPMQFIPLLEETGLILQVGSWALGRACSDYRGWLEQGLKAPRVALNISPIQLRERDFVGVLQRTMALAPSAPGIDLEISESAIMDDIGANIERLAALRALGVNIAIDDFGTSFSVLAYLARLPVQSLKIDRSLICLMQENSNAMTTVTTIISLAHSLKLKVVAEGVETEAEANLLRLLECDEMQGYLFSKPLPRDMLAGLLRG